MHISDHHVDALRAFFVTPEDHDRQMGRLNASHDLLGYRAMVAAMLFELANRRFGPTERAAEITRWVADTRARLLREERSDLCPDPAAAEGLLRTVSGLPAEYADLEEGLRGETQYLLLGLLRMDLNLEGEALDDVLEQARSTAARADQAEPADQ